MHFINFAFYFAGMVSSGSTTSMHGIQIRMISHPQQRTPSYLPSIRELLDQVNKRHLKTPKQTVVAGRALLMRR